jgi:hypothetical protein
MSNFKPDGRVSALYFFVRKWRNRVVYCNHFLPCSFTLFSEIDTTNGFPTLSSFRSVLFSASDSSINTRFTAGKPVGVWDCHASRGHQKTTIFTSIVYGFCWLLNFLFCPQVAYLPKAWNSVASGKDLSRVHQPPTPVKSCSLAVHVFDA